MGKEIKENGDSIEFLFIIRRKSDLDRWRRVAERLRESRRDLEGVEET